MAMNYNLGLRQDMLNKLVSAKKAKDVAHVGKYNREEKKKRQDKKGLMSAIANIALAVYTGGASIPYQAAYGGIANKALMGDDYEGSTMQGLQTLGSMAYKGAQQEKQKGLSQMEGMHKNRLDSIYKAIDALPPEAKMERPRLINQAADLTNQFHRNFKAADAAPAWKYASSERERQQAKTLGEEADKGQREYESMYGGQGRLALNPKKDLAASGKHVVSPEYWKKYGTMSQVQEQYPVSVPSGGGGERQFSNYPGLSPNLPGLSPREEVRGRNMQARQLGQPLMNLGSHVMDDDWQYGDQPPNERQRLPRNPYSWR